MTIMRAPRKAWRGGRKGETDQGWGLVIAIAAMIVIGLSPATASAQGGRTRVEYDVEFSVPGSLLDPNCTATGTDVLTGTLVGFEPALPDEPNEYVGTMMRSTRISICGSRTNARGEDVVCSIDIAGGGFPDVILTIDPGQRDGYFQYLTDPNSGPQGVGMTWASLLLPPPAGQAFSTVTGTCDPVELAQLQASYDTGDTAGSPNGQPIELPGLPPVGPYPFTFGPNPPVSIWTLKLLARRP